MFGKGDQASGGLAWDDDDQPIPDMAYKFRSGKPTFGESYVCT